MSESSDEPSDLDFIKQELEMAKAALMSVWVFTESDERMTLEIHKQIDELVNKADAIFEEIEEKLGINGDDSEN